MRKSSVRNWIMGIAVVIAVVAGCAAYQIHYNKTHVHYWDDTFVDPPDKTTIVL